MGNSSTKNQGSTNETTTTETNTEDNKSTEGDVPVILHVYRPSEENNQIGGIYHSGVEVYGSEYYFAGGVGSGSGVHVQKPKAKPAIGTKWVYDQSVEISKINKSRQEVRDIIQDLREEFPASSYHLTSRNCNHFSEALCLKLCNKSIPSWVNRMASLGNMFSGMVAPTSLQPQNQQNNTLQAFGGAYDHVKPQPLPEIVQETKANFLIDCINMNNIGSLNAVNNNNLFLLFTQDLTKNPIPITSSSDEQLLLFIPFKQRVTLESIGLALPTSLKCPKSIKLFVNQPNLDFSDVDMYKPSNIINIKEIPNNQKQAIYWCDSYQLKAANLRNVNYLTIFIDENFGDDVSQIYKIEFWGQK